MRGSADDLLEARRIENEGRFQCDSVDSSRFVCGGHSDGYDKTGSITVWKGSIDVCQRLVPAFRSSDADNLAGDLEDPLFPRAPPFTRSFHAITVLCSYLHILCRYCLHSGIAHSKDCEPLVGLTT